MAVAAMQAQIIDKRYRFFSLKNLLHVDWLLGLVVIALAIIGWLTLYSASRSSEIFSMYRQIAYFFAGLLLTAGIVCFDYRFLLNFAPLFYALAVGALFLVIEFGHIAKGSERWLDLGLFNLQPSEPTKVIMVYALTWYFTMLGERIRQIWWFLLAFLVAGLPIVLILEQPNLGTAASLLPLTMALLFIAGCRFWHIGAVILLGLSVVPLVAVQMYNFDPNLTREQVAALPEPEPYELEYYQKMRIYAFLHPEADPKGSGWQTRQSMISVGSGGMTGKGYLNSTQTRLNYLPEHHTDFIFSLFAEENGFLGSAILIGIFAVLLLRGIQFAREARDMHGTLLAVGAVTVLAFHIFVNIAITIGLMPVTGIPLPFLSFGGNFYLTTMMCIGIMMSVPVRRHMVAESGGNT